ncbi:hypothetical protein A3K34_02930 [candidate division WWE3 bacterium RIFOXYC1_FULL_40_10]|nr:MAG: hypothetical protein A3K58_02930 [candidate division WWE3 bacterium RIFOXYB1_FULL_40_22]OGC61801.1 MAG: hypothetical protein A3K37_02930 [candidate division WWE3 bacterium RIFOXYA1_FULL_40_11]OGC66184.1 MAG: hypothetical protein A3K34_02930 [candidate division WWE3 bacterium RIFOXYC1_FULL_40_10]OGC67579.1 MAG: hypothetical protein A2450_03820 [candidate division WWE3 bacterium RIFOXYC2_FULL_40_11]OGC70169.1 MAG: hypothetical protein A2602_00420 [candidate division WWE3 bacterium RIFOXYD
MLVLVYDGEQKLTHKDLLNFLEERVKELREKGINMSVLRLESIDYALYLINSYNLRSNLLISERQLDKGQTIKLKKMRHAEIGVVLLVCPLTVDSVRQALDDHFKVVV